MGKRSTDTTFNPVTILLGAITTLLASFGYVYVQYTGNMEKQIDRVADSMVKQNDRMAQYIDEDRTDRQAHLIEFDQVKWMIKDVQKDLKKTKETSLKNADGISEIRIKQNKYWPEH